MTSAIKSAWRRSKCTAQKVSEKVSVNPVPSSWTMGNGQSPVAGTEPVRDPSFGTDPTIKTLYEGKSSRGGKFDWVETPPKQLNQKVAKAYDRVSIRVYKVRDPDQLTISGRTPLKFHAIELQSPILVSVLKSIVEAQGVFLEETETARFEAPFIPLFFCYDDIIALYQRSQEDIVLRPHLQILLQVLGEIFGGIQAQLRNLHASGLISYKLAWTYFPRGSAIYSGEEGDERLYRVIDTAYADHSSRFSVSCQEISFNGEIFDWKTTKVEIPSFEGNLPVNALPSYPLSFHEDQQGLKGKLIKRAKEVLDYQQLTYRYYSGVSSYGKGSTGQKHIVSGRILIDYHGYRKHHRGHAPSDSKPKNGGNSGASENPSSLNPLSEDDQQKNKTDMLARENDLIFMSPTLRGFSLKAKLWMKFHVDDIKPLVWNDEAYGHLVYPEEQKDLVLTFVENHQRMKKSGIDDVIRGKGQGLVILLSGPPGTGKTLTAEAVADKTRRPLYYLQAEDLGTNVSSLSTNIKKVFEMATEWNAVILLDGKFSLLDERRRFKSQFLTEVTEADVFMAHRAPSDIARNELVSIFLRELEYFSGIIFLTTNLFETIDAAFRSRVNIHLYFSSLSFESRLILWRKFLSRLPPSRVVPDPLTHLTNRDLAELGKWELNGREIKNAIKTVRNWCECKDYAMTLGRLESGIMVTAPSAKKIERGDVEEVD